MKNGLPWTLIPHADGLSEIIGNKTTVATWQAGILTEHAELIVNAVNSYEAHRSLADAARALIGPGKPSAADRERLRAALRVVEEAECLTSHHD